MHVINHCNHVKYQIIETCITWNIKSLTTSITWYFTWFTFLCIVDTNNPAKYVTTTSNRFQIYNPVNKCFWFCSTFLWLNVQIMLPQTEWSWSNWIMQFTSMIWISAISHNTLILSWIWYSHFVCLPSNKRWYCQQFEKKHIKTSEL